MVEAIYINGIFKTVLDEILASQRKVPDRTFFLQPYESRYYARLRNSPPSPEQPVTLYASLSNDLDEVRYIAELVGWEDKTALSAERRREVEEFLARYQEDEGGLYVKGREDSSGEAVNLLSIRNLRELSAPFNISELIKDSDGAPLKPRTRSGGLSYVYQRDYTSPSHNSRFGWVQFFEKFADRLVDFEREQRTLIDAVHDAFRSVNSDAKIEGDAICPFTVMASFNLHAHLRYKTRRQDIAASLRRSLQVQVADFDGEFDGVPTITRRWWFFREADDVESLWQVFRCAKDFADNRDDNERKAAFETSFENALRIDGLGQSKLTSGLFWIRPNFYVSVDSNNLPYIRSHFPHPLVSKAAQRNLSGAEYMELCTHVRNELSEPRAQVDSIPALSDAAWREKRKRSRVEDKLEQFFGGLGEFDREMVQAEIERVSVRIAPRPDQDSFRQDLLGAYEGCCAITGYNVEATLQASHILPHKDRGPGHVRNGLLLRADIHALFDKGLLAIDPDSDTVVIAPRLRGTPYEELDGQTARLPSDPHLRPNAEELRKRLRNLSREQ